jgi:hypothetical protein
MNNEVIKYKARLNKVIAKGKHYDCPGVARKLRRQLRNAEKKAETE